MIRDERYIFPVSHSKGQRPDEEDLEERILRAAEALLTSEGPGFTMEALAQAVGVSRATLYRRVPSREKLAERLRQERAVEPGTALTREPSRQKILETTRQLVGRLGLVALTVEQIAEAAGVSPVTIYRTFGDKDALLRTMFAELGPRSEAAALFAELDAPLEDTLTRFVLALFRWRAEQPAFFAMLIFSQGEEARYVEQLRERQYGTTDRLARYLAAQAERGRLRPGSPVDRALGLIGLALGATFDVRRLLAEPPPATAEASTEPGHQEARARAVVELFLHGVAASRAEGDAS
ncbi:helix-turn-helix transcriptional regulator [Archangium minus]|uniref:Helix-turn-helix transcriptional regulator n=1 Tax=Archangium minus TaxID=83450 RepID=A0ABY9WNK1_9BACT|nr:helix-turn-helix transcriptional regulator [Archangium minus]